MVSVEQPGQHPKVVVTCSIQNTGERAGAEIAQVYVRDTECSVERPLKELKGFAKIFLQPGEKKTVRVELDEETFKFFDIKSNSWILEPGEFEILVGKSSQEIILKQTLNL